MLRSGAGSGTGLTVHIRIRPFVFAFGRDVGSGGLNYLAMASNLK